MLKVSANEVVKSAKSLLDKETVFVWGASGEVISNDVIKKAIAIEPKRYNHLLVSYLERLIGTETLAFDCIGVVRYCTKNNEPMTTDELFERAIESGPIETIPEIPGTLVYMEKNHCGIYIGNNEVIESTYAIGVGFGVTKTILTDRNWTHWFKSHWIAY